MSSKVGSTRSAREMPGVPVIEPRYIESETRDEELVSRRREELIHAAIKVFGEKGFHGATVRDIGRAANMTQGTIYNYVRSKDDILYLVCDRIISSYLATAKTAVAASHNPVDRVRSAVRAIATVMCEYRSEIRLIYQNTYLLERKSLRELLARVEQFISLFENLLIDAGRDLKRPVPHSHFRANIITFLPGIVAFRGWSLRGDLSNEELIAEITEFLIRGLGLE